MGLLEEWFLASGDAHQPFGGDLLHQRWDRLALPLSDIDYRCLRCFLACDEAGLLFEYVNIGKAERYDEIVHFH